MRVKSQPRHLPRREPTHSDTKKYVQQQDDSKHFTSSKVLTENSKEIHTDVKPYKCKTCDKAFKQELHLQIHERIHSGEKPYQCELCEKAFNQKVNLNTHKKHCNGQNYKCIVCRKGFNTQQNLRHHVDMDHPRERLHKCNQCPAIFTYRYNLFAHIKRRTGKKYLCEVCGKAFSTKYSKDRHRNLVHSDKKPFECLVSGKCYKEKDSLHEHMRI